MTKRVPEMLVERYVAGDLSPQRMSEVELRLREEQGGLERLAVLRASNETERVAHPPEQLMPEITRRARALALAPKPALRARLLWLPAPLLAVAVLVFVVIRAPEPSDDVITLKGLTPSVRVWRRSVGVDRMLASGTLARAGDLLVLEVAPVTAGHAVLLSIDGAGKVTLHHPSTPTADTRVTGAAFFVDGGYTLDDAPGFERFVLVTADEAIDVGAVLAAGQVVALGSIARSGPLELAPHLKQAPFMLVKSQGHSVSPRDGGREPGLDD